MVDTGIMYKLCINKFVVDNQSLYCVVNAKTHLYDKAEITNLETSADQK